jgi:acyl-CoA synthetase (AMP-forming)/AMP-acid ligase II
MKKFSEPPFPGLKNIVQLLQVHAEISPHKAITNVTDPALTCNQLNQLAKKFAAVLQEIVRPEQKIVLFYDNEEEAFPLFFACWYAGLTVVPVDFIASQLHSHYLPNLMTAIKPDVFLTNKTLYAEAKNILNTSVEFHNAWHLLNDEIVATTAKWHDPSLEDASVAILEYHFDALDGATQLVETTHYSLLNDTLAITEIAGYQQHLPVITKLLKTVYCCKQLKGVIATEDDEEDSVLKYAM